MTSKTALWGRPWHPMISTRKLGCPCHWSVWNLTNLALTGSSRYECFTVYESVFPSNTCS